MFVVLFHLWPGLVPFGFVGVDLFFVISGFLITSHLMAHAAREGKVQLGTFWARRIRRLLPAAFVVIFATSLGVFLLQSQSLWHGFTRQAIGSTFYFENWILATDSVDYLNSHNAPTPVQQFWSLSVEEQFYIVWPLLIALGLLLARLRFKRSSLRKWSTAILGMAVLASFAWSIYLGAIGDKSGYFSTFTRAWEFGAGGLIAVAVPLLAKFGPRLATFTAFTGWVLIAVSAVVISPTTSFPGYAAALPVAGVGLVIAGGTRSSRAESQASRWWRPVFFLGGISYSLYLWHWPLITLFPDVFGVVPSAGAKIAILVVCIALAWFSTRFIERPAQKWRVLAEGPAWRTFVVGALAAGLTLVPALIATASIQGRLTAEQAVRSVSIHDSCFGAASSLAPEKCATVAWPVLTPDPAVAREDLPTAANKCKTDTLIVTRCQFGVIGAPIKIALVGDSHAGHWFPAFEKLANDNGFELDIYLKSSCTFLVAQRSPLFKNCSTWSSSVIKRLQQDAHYSYVVVNSLAANLADEITKGEVNSSAALAGFESTWSQILARGSHIVVIRDTPHMAEDTSICIAKHYTGAESCTVPLSVAFAYSDFEAEAGAKKTGVSVIDVSKVFCSASCHPVVAGAIAFSDSHHMTATFSRSFAPVLTKQLAALGWPVK
jgi:peptidoglycan/LPS O-acetylase OafA/YrhL